MIALLGLVVLLAQAAPAMPTPPPSPRLENQVPVAQTPAPMGIPLVPGIDRTFALVAIQSNNAEMVMARLALSRGTAPEVKAFAQKMITEHGDLAADMTPSLDRVLGASPPDALAAPDRLAMEHLQTISNVDFDRVYASGQVAGHLMTLTAFRTEADNGTDPQLKALARKWIPTIESHLQLAVGVTQHIGGASPFKSP